MENFARYLMISRIFMFLIGGGIYLAAKFGIPLGNVCPAISASKVRMARSIFQ